MAEWRIARGWSEEALAERLRGLASLRRNYQGSHGARMEHPGWDTHGSRSLLGTLDARPPEDDGSFERARDALRSYAFSDPSIVEAHFDRSAPLPGRRMLLELKVPGLRYLCGVIVGEVREEASSDSTTFGFRYDTLEGHVERGSEWFLLKKDHESGEVHFEIEATWQPGDFPNWWSRFGFHLVGKHYQRRWHTRAHQRMAAFLAGTPIAAPPSGRQLAHQGPEVAFTRAPAGEIEWTEHADEDEIEPPRKRKEHA